MIIKGWDKIEITKTFTLNFQVVVMEINAHIFISHSFWMLKNNVEKNGTNLPKPILIVMEHYLQTSFAIGEVTNINIVRVIPLWIPPNIEWEGFIINVGWNA
jgi:hypothetical protein